MFMNMDMMKKMMGGKGPEGTMGGEEKGGEKEESPSPMPLMMVMCAEMLSPMERTAAMAVFAPPEFQGMFREWREALEVRALSSLAKDGASEIGTLAAYLGITRESAATLPPSWSSRGSSECLSSFPREPDPLLTGEP